MIGLPSPHDESALKASFWKDPKNASLVETNRKAIYDLEEILLTMKESEIIKRYGPTKKLDDCYVLPFFRHRAVAFSGLGYKGNHEMYFLHIGEAGGVLVFPYGDRDFISAVALYLKTDESFISLKSQNDLTARRAWDQLKLAELSKIIRQ